MKASSMSQVWKWLKLPYEYFVLYVGLFIFGVMSLSWSLPATVLYPILPRRMGAALGQRVIMIVFRSYLFILKASGLVEYDLSALDVLRHEGALIIAPNHPSLIDVVLIASRLPRIVGIMKAKIWDNLLLGGGARLAGYIRNDSPASMIRLAAAAMHTNSQLLVFPEGTRTLSSPLNHFKGGFALIAKTSGMPVQTVFIEANTPFLGKGWPLLKKPEFPLIYRARLGRRFEVTGEVKTFVTDLEHYFQQQPEIQNFQPYKPTLKS